jgi:hypothetical protein
VPGMGEVVMANGPLRCQRRQVTHARLNDARSSGWAA